jgi:hypothetical protein
LWFVNHKLKTECTGCFKLEKDPCQAAHWGVFEPQFETNLKGLELDFLVFSIRPTNECSMWMLTSPIEITKIDG